MRQTKFAAIPAVLVLVVLATPLFAGGNRERTGEEPEIQQIPVVGRVVEITEIDGDRTDLTIATEAGPEVIVEIPTRMARSLRIAEGDRFSSEERVLNRPGERARILEFTIERGR